MIQWHKVTWYSQILAIILSIIIFFMGYYLGSVKRNYTLEATPSEVTENTKEQMSFQGFQSTIKDLPQVPSAEKWDSVLENSGVHRDRVESDFSKFGEIAKRFYADKEYQGYYIDIDYADITSDGIPEKIVSFDGGGTYGIIKYEIVSGDKIIASIKPQSVGRSGAFQPDPTGNGFSMIWYTEDMFPGGFCCPAEKMVTRFEYKNNVFVSTNEQRSKVTN